MLRDKEASVAQLRAAAAEALGAGQVRLYPASPSLRTHATNISPHTWCLPHPLEFV
jgi:hypothetical protein